MSTFCRFFCANDSFGALRQARKTDSVHLAAFVRSRADASSESLTMLVTAELRARVVMSLAALRAALPKRIVSLGVSCSVNAGRRSRLHHTSLISRTLTTSLSRLENRSRMTMKALLAWVARVCDDWSAMMPFSKQCSSSVSFSFVISLSVVELCIVDELAQSSMAWSRLAGGS